MSTFYKYIEEGSREDREALPQAPLKGILKNPLKQVRTESAAFIEPIGWRALRCGLELAFCSAKTFILTPRCDYTVEKLHCGADRVVAPSGSR